MSTTKNSNLRKKAYAAVTSLLLASASSIIYNPPAQAAGTPEGTIIGNQATATYKDAGNNDFTSTSNLVTTTITAVYSFVLSPDSADQSSEANAQTTVGAGQVQNSTAGNIVYFPYTLTNNSNTTDTYELVMTQGSASTKVPENVELYIDANGNGFIDVGDSLIRSGLGTVTINDNGTVGDTSDDYPVLAGVGSVANVPADGQVKLIVKYQVPVDSLATDFITVDLKAKSTNVTGATSLSGSALSDSDSTNDPKNVMDSRNYNRVNIVNDAVVAITKAVDKGTANPGEDLEYTFTITNTGNKVAENIRLIDTIPKDLVAGRITDFVVGSTISTEGTFSYDSFTDTDTFTYDLSLGEDGTDGDSVITASPVVGALPPFLQATDVPGVASGANPYVTKIRYDLASLAPGNTRTIKFKVRVRATLSQAQAGLIPNNAPYSYDTQATVLTPAVDPVTSTTNTVNTDINKKSAVLISFDGSPFSPQTTSGLDGTLDDASTQASAPANSYVYYKQVVTNNGNSDDTFNITTFSNSFPAGSNVSFLQLTDGTIPGNNTSPLLDTNGDSLIDTGNITSGSTKTIVARVFIPSTVTGVAPYTAVVQAASTNGGSAVGTGAGNVLTDTTRDVVTSIQAPSVNLENYIDSGTSERGYAEAKDVDTTVSANASANGTTVSYPVTVQNRGGAIDSFNLSGALSGTLLSSGATLSYYPVVTKNTVASLTSAGATSVTLQDATGFSIGDQIIINGQSLTVGSISSNTITFASGQSLYEDAVAGETAVEPGTTTITSTNPIAAASPITTVPAGASAGATSVILASTSGISVGNIIKIVTSGGDEFFTLSAVNTGTGEVTFVSGQALVGTVAADAMVSEVHYQSVVAVVSVPVDTAPIAAGQLNVTLNTTSTNDISVTDQVINNLVIPDFRDFTLVANRSGSAAAGTVLFYDHTLTNTGNSDGTFDISIVTDGLSPNFVYQLLDENNNSIPVTVTINSGITTIKTTAPISVLKASPIYNFKVKVTIPAGTAPSTVDTITVKADQIGGTTKTNTDITTVVAGFIQLSKTVKNITTGGAANTTNTAIPGDILEYVIDYENVGSDTAYNVKLTDLIPANTTYVDNTMRFDADGTAGVGASVAVTDNYNPVTATDDEVAASGDFNISTPNAVTFFVGTGQTKNLGGTVTSGGKGAIIFRVQVN